MTRLCRIYRIDDYTTIHFEFLILRLAKFSKPMVTTHIGCTRFTSFKHKRHGVGAMLLKKNAEIGEFYRRFQGDALFKLKKEHSSDSVCRENLTKNLKRSVAPTRFKSIFA